MAQAVSGVNLLSIIIFLFSLKNNNKQKEKSNFGALGPRSKASGEDDVPTQYLSIETLIIKIGKRIRPVDL